MIKEITKFQNDEKAYRTFDTIEAAKNDKRREVVEKYILEGDAPSHYWDASGWNNTARWYTKEEHMKGKLNANQNGWYEGRRSAIASLIKFYPDIISKLSEIDAQKVKETK